MTNEIIPSPPSEPGIWDKIIEAIGSVNLPKVIAGPAGEALARLIAGGADIPAAWLQGRAQEIKDRTEARSLMTKTLSGAAAELVKGDPALVQRAAEAFIAKEIGHQHNRETIAIKAIEHLKESPDAQTARPDDDWLNMFARHAQEASSDRMQDLWSKILAGQLRTANSFSLQTLRFASELDETTAALFEKWAGHVVERRFIPFPPQDGLGFSELLQLEDIGLLTGVASLLSNQIKDENVVEYNGIVIPLVFNMRSCAIVVQVKKPFSINYRCALLTRIGRELYPITKTQSTIEIARHMAGLFPKQNVSSITAIIASEQPHRSEVLWTDPQGQPPQ